MATPIVPSSALEFHLTGGINGQTNTNPFRSLGGLMATARIQDNKMDNLWDPVAGQEQVDGLTEYRWIVLFNNSTEILRSPHFYFMPQDPNVGLEFSRLAISQPPEILPTEEDRPSELEIGPEEDVPLPFTKTTDTYETTGSIYANNVPAGGKLFICLRRTIPEDSISENRAYILVVESRVPLASSFAYTASTSTPLQGSSAGI